METKAGLRTILPVTRHVKPQVDGDVPIGARLKLKFRLVRDVRGRAVGQGYTQHTFSCSGGNFVREDLSESLWPQRSGQESSVDRA